MPPQPTHPTTHPNVGYLATPIIEALQRRGLFRLLDASSFREGRWLARELEANPGYLTIALEALELLGWIERNEAAAYRRTEGSAGDLDDFELTPLYATDPRQWDDPAPSVRMLVRKLEEIASRPARGEYGWPALAQGAVAVPLALTREELGADAFERLLDEVAPERSESIAAVLRAQRDDEFEVIGSYRALLHGMGDLLFGDPQRAFSAFRESTTAERSRRRGWPALPRSCGADFQQEIAAIFDEQAVERQPGANVEVSARHGHVLEDMLRTIREQTGRGAHLQELPLRVPGASDPAHGLTEVAETLDGTAHEAVTGEAARPEGLRRAFEGGGVRAEGAVPQLRLLVDHLIAVDGNPAIDEGLATLVVDQPAHYLDPHGGLLTAGPVLSAWKRHFGALAEDGHRARLLMLVAHAAPAGWRGPDAESSAFLDVIRRLAHEHAITADAFITLAASQGLFNDGVPGRYPRGSGPCELSLHRLARRDHVVRQATESDVSRLCELEELCWQHTRTPEARIRARVQQYPQGQFVLEKEGAVAGVIYSQRLSATDALAGRTAADVHELHRASGPIVQLLALNVDPQAQNLSLGDQLLEFFLQRSTFLPGVERVVGVTLCKSYQEDGSRSFGEYIRQRGAGQDPVLAFHQRHGAEIGAVVAGYRPEDRANGGHGVLVVYDLARRAPRQPRHEAPTAAEASAGGSAMAALEPRQVREWVQGEAARLLRVSGREVDVDRPLMEMGLDSADLLSLQQRCEDRFGRQLGVGFFFEHSTCARVAAFLAPNSAGVPGASAARTTSVKSGASSQAQRRPAAADGANGDVDDRDVAVVGMACRLPGGIETPGQLWQLLASGASVIGAYPAARGRWARGAGYPGIDLGGFVTDVGAFDEAFFRMSPAEAQRTDPQQRILLETAWTCLEDAGILPAELRGTSTGVFVGASNCDYGRLIQEAGLEVEAHHGVGSALAVIANRVSYFFDWCGPSLLIDTACSSSLVALHSAIQSLRSGECATALVGGVNVICHPDLSMAYHKAGMLAPDGRCKVFDARADGYVRSEGAVALLLKPLRQAIADRDQIRAVLRGSAINHGGLAAGLTVPSPAKQSELLQAAWTAAGIAAHELTYIEAHGTGTALGDPIEVEGMLGAYAAVSAGRRSKGCGIGSVKSNLGHLEAAAGMAGLLKVIVSMQRRELPATINFERLNPKIRLEGSPFHVQERQSRWEAEGPLVAGVSSFGSGGTNAHVVVQEYAGRARDGQRDGDHLFVLSARDQDRLKAHVAKAAAWLEEASTDVELRDAVYTWQVGRVGMTQRLAIKAKDRAELSNKLKQWLAGVRDVADVWCGEATSDTTGVGRVWRSTSGRQLIDRALVEMDLEQLAVLWTSGAEIEWRRLHETAEGGRPRRRSLPTYPFAGARHWIEAAVGGPGAARQAAAAILHPLLHCNTSDLAEQRYTSTFTGEEFFLADHGLKAEGGSVRKVLPAVAHLEMARAAVERSCPEPAEGARLELRDVAWMQPVVVAEGTRVSIALSAQGDEQIDYEIYSRDAEEEKVHCRGRAVWSREPVPARLDLEAIAGEIGPDGTEADGVPAARARTGVVCGPSLRSITAVRRGNNQALAKLRLPAEVEDRRGDYVLHPSLMDGALQAGIGLQDGGSAGLDLPRWPLGVEALRIVSPCRKEMVAWARYSRGSEPGHEASKVDVDLCDASGNVCVQIEGLSLCTPSTESDARAVPGEGIGCLMAIPVWQAGDAAAAAEGRPAEYVEHHVILCELPQAGGEALEASLPRSRCVSLPAQEGRTIAQRYGDYALACFERVQAILQSKPQGKVLVQIVVAGDSERSLFAGLSGLLRTAALESPQLAGQVILVPAELGGDALAERLRREKDHGLDTLIRYEAGERQVLRWRELAAASEEPAFALSDPGVYVITGGLGGLGIVFAREILERTRQARVVVTGRSAPTAATQARLAGLGAEAGRASYRQLDLGDLADVERVIGDIQAEHGALNGILHCAGMIADSVIIKKSGAQFRDVLAPKVLGTFHLDHASRGLGLDFFVLFSSINSATGNPGQADYAAANGFMDEFAAYRNGQVAAGVRHGRTRSIHWPLWQAGGMGVDAATQAMLEQMTGVRPMRTATGLRAFHHVLALPHDRVLVAEGVTSRIAAYLQRAGILAPILDTSPARVQPGALGRAEAIVSLEQLEQQLKVLLAGVLRINASAIDSHQAFVDLGLESFLGTELVVAVNKKYGTALSNTRIYDYPTVRELASLLAQEIEKLPVHVPASPGAAVGSSAPARPRAPIARGAARGTRTGARHRGQLEDQIAIVGTSGRYPGARNLREYWRNLLEGRNSVVEVPASRWDVKRYYDPDRTRTDKTVSKWMGALDDVDCFDPLFFRISPQEAEYMDPQHRLFLQEGYKAFEDAGYAGSVLSERKCGVYLGITTNEYHSLLSRNGILPPITSNSHAIAAGRIAYHLNLKGPAIPIDTACSSSLVAMHLACQALINREIDLALAGGITLWLTPESYVAMSQAGMLSAVGQCRTFDDSADGIVNGEGVGTVVLKRLRDAQADNDLVYGVILGSGVNQDGKTNGITAPSVNSQIELARGIYAKYGIDPETISYVEAHGTGTPLGDPIELEALAAVFSEKTTRKGFCGLGSVKSNIGHTTAAAGVAGVQKVLLSMRHRTLVPSLNVAKETSRFDFASSPFYVCRATRPWDVAPSARRLAAVSSFGFSGTNAHMVIGEYVAAAESRRSLTVVARVAQAVVPLSARRPEQLREKAVELLEFIREEAPSIDLACMAYTLQVGRDAMEERLSFVVSTVEEAAAKLEAYVAGGREVEDVYRGQVKRGREALSSFGSDSDLRQTVDRWIAAGRLAKLAELWAKGLDFDWSKLYGEAKPARISLPTYPFARERYWIPDVKATAAEARRTSAAAGPSGETWGEYWKAHDALLVKALWSQLRSLGLLAEAESSVARWKAAIGLPPVYARWLDETMVLLAERGHLSYDGEWCRLTDPVTTDSASIRDEWNGERDRWSQDPDLRVPGILVETTLRALPEILTGRQPATEIIFPNASMELVEGVYKNNAQADYFNAVLADAAVAHFEEHRRRGSDARIRILEIGAGTGGSTAVLLRKLDARRECIDEYCYSDISRAFLIHGEEHYGRHPFVTFRLFDVEKPLGPQGIEIGGYDAVIATNVLHATRNIRETLRNAKAALRPGGILFLNEMAASSLYTHLTFGLLEGWWLYEDPELRSRGCPALSSEAWSRVLAEAGFRSVSFAARESMALGQQIIAAESDGAIRQAQGASDPKEPARGNVPAQPAVRTAPRTTGTAGITESVHSFLVEAVSHMMKLKAEDVDLDAELSEVGFDSITLTGFSNHLNRTLQLNLTPSIFFEYPTLRGFAAHLVKTHAETLGRRFCLWGPTDEGAIQPQRAPAASTATVPLAGACARSHDGVRPAVPEEPRPTGPDAVAIIGMSGCFPQADDVDAFWQNLLEGRDCIREIPKERWNWRSLQGSSPEEIQWAGLIDGVDEFDPLFFGISPREAELMDPQQRLLMTHVWKAIEDAGYAPQNLSGTSTALLVGTINSGYCEVINKAQAAARGDSATGTVPSIGPNRMSYLLNLHGPSEPIETACSSALVAIHRGRELITSGQCEMAIVGGVNTLVSPEAHLGFSKAGMLSPDGRCKAFSAGANGYVRGEGAGLLVLKTLKAAERDGDHIYAVLRGSTENHGGRSNSLTAPNPKAQAELIKSAYVKAGIDGRSVGYIEAHGTGTALGDPVEIDGLKSAFQELYELRGAGQALSPHCGLGSVKSNIGHLELAAGAAGVIKVLLQMRHKTLVKTLHCDEINPYIRLEGSPFHIVRENQAWEPLRDEQGRELPRRAGVSSFGFGGVNAHVVLEEHVPAPRRVRTRAEPALIVLSARSDERLREQARRLHAAIATRGLNDLDLEDLAYTLQVGREAMEHRVAIVARSMNEVQQKLAEFIAGQPAIEDVYRGELKRNREVLAVFKADEELQEAILKWIEHGKLSKLLGLWVKGLDFDWNRLYGDNKPRRLSLPTYPFARERYWIQASADRQVSAGASAAPAVLHPLLHGNTSHLNEQRYSSTLTGQEFFLADHRLNVEGAGARKVLPGVAYLEMARAALEDACPDRPEAATLELSHVVWARPVVVSDSDSQRIDIGLVASDGDVIDYEIYSEATKEEVVHGQGRATWSRRPAPARLDLETIQREIGPGTVAADHVYAAFARMGVVYGPSFRAVSAIEQGNDQALARLRLPDVAADTLEDYVLHPSLMDGALQTCIGLLDGWSEGVGQARLPFALEGVRILSACRREMVAWVRYSPGSQATDKVVKLDIDLCAPDGHVCVQVHGLSTRLLSAESGLSAASGQETGCLMATPVWQASRIDASADASPAEYAEQHVILCETRQVDRGELESLLSDSRCVSLRAQEPETIAQRYGEVALACFERIQAVLRSKPHGRLLVQLVCAGDPEGSLFAGLSGLLKTASLENPQLVGQLILVPPDMGAGELARRLESERSYGRETLVRYEQGQRQVMRWQEASAGAEGSPLALRERGVYLVTGGLGGLGLVLAREILERTSHARVILAGRSALDAERQARLEPLSAEGRVSYRRVDLADLEAVEQLIGVIRDEHGQLDGILHCAGIVADSFILKKSSAQFREVLAPKVTGTFNLDQASAGVVLDFFVFFSSLTSAIGNLGQADYAAANGFMDQFAAYRNGQVAKGQRHGRTRSIHWPLWQAGGMAVDAETREQLARTTGIRAMRTETGVRALYRSLALPHDELLVAEGDLWQMRQALLAGPAAPEPRPKPSAAATSIDSESLAAKAQDYLRQQLSGLLKLPAHKIDPQAALEKYGIDSILAIKMTNHLELTFGSLPKTLFFEYQTLGELTEYLLGQHSQQLTALFATPAADPGGGAAESAVPASPVAATPRIASRRRSPRRAAGPSAAPEGDLIAIIGLSGRYPGAIDIEAYWRNLREGKDCIVEVPKERWDWREYYSEDRTRSGHHYSKWGGFITGVDEFDSLFFSISPKEAAYIDPQERLFLEHAWKAIEDAGYTRASLQVPCEGDLPGQVGVYAGVWTTEYQMFGAEASILGERVGVAGSVANVANRVSYALNLHGPSMTLDTMCSASLTAIHLACEGLRQGRTSLAIAGGVNVNIHPNKYLVLSALQAISTDGHCQAFGEGGDGYIPAEGVGVVVLKRLADAERDGDHIYGVIRGSALNHGGKTNGYTVPNPQAQASAISRALAESKTDARHVSYVEAHGTGTRLGDPIEIAGLSKAFQHYTQDTEFCRIGSAKSNIGHCESAAGVAGLTKVLLQMQHRQIAPSLHSAQLNPHIDFNRSPFVVNQQLMAWEQPELDGRRLPRVAGVSSFGAGGSNAHLIVEEYEAPARQSLVFAPVAIVLSARTAEQLQQKARDLLQFVRERPGTTDLTATAYTLQVGREAMEERLGLVVSTAEELAARLEAFLAGEREIEAAWHGQAKRHREALALFSSDADLQQAVDRWLAARKLSKVVELWAKGLDLDWSKLYPQGKPGRISLPTYPFARERHWIPDAKAALVGAGARPAPALTAAVLHPLLYRNTSNLAEQRFSSTFSGEESFFCDHVVKAQRVLPGVAYLEMARAGVELAAGASPQEPAAVELKNVVWVQPVIPGANGVEVHLGLYPTENGAIDYEIYSAGEAADGSGRVVHGQGRALLVHTRAEAARVDVARLQGVCQQRALGHAECYEALRAAGLEYGPSHQAIEALYRGVDGARGPQVLARLKLPACAQNASSGYVLHPSLMDAALQATLGLTLVAQDGANPPRVAEAWLPFLLEGLEIRAACPASGWAWVRYREGGVGADARKIDVDVCDEQGAVCIRLQGLTGRGLKTDAGEAARPAALEASVGTLLLTPVWDAAPLERGETSPSPTEKLVIVGGRDEQQQALRQRFPAARTLALDPGAAAETLAEELQALGSVDHLFWIVADVPVASVADESLVDGQKQAVVFGFRLIKALLRLGFGGRKLGWTIVTRQAQAVDRQDTVCAVHASVHGLIGSMAKEYPNWKVRLVDLEGGAAWPLDEILALGTDPHGEAWAHRGGQWYRQQLVRCELPAARQGVYRAGGVYVVIGGAGGVGEVFSEYLIRSYGAQLVWIGRRERDAPIAAKQERLSRLGPSPDYVQADAGDLEQLRRAHEQILRQHGAVHGVIHAALQLLDKSLWQMEEERFTRALSAKVDTSVRMAQVFARDELDFVMFFSSLQSFGKAAGQSNYAAGCTFIDAYAHELGRQWARPVKVVNWGYWGGVGVVATKDYQDRMAQAGLGSLEPEEGMLALGQLVASPLAQVMVLKVTKPEALTSLRLRPEERVDVARHEAPALLDRLEEAKGGGQAPEVLIADKQSGEAFETLLAKLLLRQLSSLGAFGGDGIEQWRRKIALPEVYAGWLQESLRALAARGYIRRAGDAWVVDKDAVDPHGAWEEWDAWKQGAVAGGRRAQARLAETTLRALPEILRGQRQAPEVLFPNAGMELVEGIYRDNAIADYFNAVLAGLLARYVEARVKENPNARLRILEIGAGTGGSTASIFAQLSGWERWIEEYTFTDLSKAFLLLAEQRWGSEHAYLRCGIFDVERPLAGQALEPGSYDVVVAGNVLHATRSMRQTVRNAKAALKRRGILLLNELAENTLFAHVTFGLTEGWWRFEDAQLRLVGSPALSTERWRQVLQHEGFAPVLFPAEKAVVLGQQIVVAESDGVIRQAQEAPESRRAVSRKAQVQPPARAVARESDSGGLLESVHAFLVEAVAQMMKVKVEDVDLDTELSEFGFDSISLTGFSNHLNQALQLELTPPIFFEHPTLRDFAAYLVKAHQEILEKKFQLWKSREVEVVETEIEPQASAAPAVLPARPARRFASWSNAVRGAAEAPTPTGSEPVAIIGISGCFPQAEDVEAFWQNLLAGRDCVSDITDERWNWRSLCGDSAEVASRPDIRWGGLIDGLDEFDPLFFGISPGEAELMDPQQRLLMAHAWKAIEDAGYSPQSLSGTNTALLVGTVNSGYTELINKLQVASSGESITGMVPSIGPNRMSYLLNLHGPSEPIETACSSALVAIHRGRELITSGQCEMAIVGGVNALVSPDAHLGFSKAGMLSPDGRCKAFSAGANGYVRGEGAGLLVLKTLKAAERDGDHIYAVLRGSTENHGGRSNSLTAPNPKAQAELIKSAYVKAGIDGRSVGYIEAHGTGTALGDPVEIDGLKSAFQELYELMGAGQALSPHCGLGSVKSNIGHLELASGVAGVIKVLLQMRHKTLVKTLHCDEINPYIRLEGSPFYIVRENQAWEPLRDEQGRELPRRAGVSSFGFGGVNAHVVLEEHVPAPRRVRTRAEPALIVLSARSDERLREQARRLHAAISTRGLNDLDLEDLAYTLQVGREAMEHRVAIVARSMNEVQEKLAEFIAGQPAIEDVHRGELKRNKEVLAAFKADEELQEAISKWIEHGKLSKLLGLWVKGLDFDWSRLYGDDKPRRLSLPTYPFAKERCWFDAQADHRVTTREHAAPAVLHPLLHSNTSDLHEQRYSSTFTGDEFFLVDHRVRTGGRRVEKVLPGAAYLEMARAAVERSWPVRTEAAVLELRDVVWAQPVVVAETRHVHIGLRANDDEELDYEIYSGDSAEPVVHGQGRAVWARQAPLVTLDLEEIERQIVPGGRVTAESVYAAFVRRGFVQGPAFRVITSILQGSTQSLTRLRLPTGPAGRWGEYVLHPSLMDGALQACAGLLDGWSEDIDQPRLPFALELLRSVLPCSPEMVAWVRCSPGQAGSKVVKLDIDLCDELGNVCVQMRGLASRVLQTVTPPSERRDHVAPSAVASVVQGEALFDSAFYRQLLTDMLNGDVTVDEAVELG